MLLQQAALAAGKIIWIFSKQKEKEKEKGQVIWI